MCISTYNINIAVPSLPLAVSLPLVQNPVSFITLYVPSSPSHTCAIIHSLIIQHITAINFAFNPRLLTTKGIKKLSL